MSGRFELNQNKKMQLGFDMKLHRRKRHEIASVSILNCP